MGPATAIAARGVTATATHEIPACWLQVEREAVALGIGDLLGMTLPPVRIIGADGAGKVGVSVHGGIGHSIR